MGNRDETATIEKSADRWPDIRLLRMNGQIGRLQGERRKHMPKTSIEDAVPDDLKRPIGRAPLSARQHTRLVRILGGTLACGLGMTIAGCDVLPDEPITTVSSALFTWEGTGAPGIRGKPAITSWGPGRLDVFARGLDNTLKHGWLNNNTPPWHWENLGGNLTSSPAAVSWGVNRIDVVARGTHNGLSHKFYNGQGWSGWSTLGGPAVPDSDPAISSWGPNRLDVFVRRFDNQVWQRSYSNNWLPTWESRGGSISSGVAAVSFGLNTIAVVGLGFDQTVRRTFLLDGIWRPWVSLGAPPDGAIGPGPSPTLDSQEPGRFDLYVQTTNEDGALYRRTFVEGFGGLLSDNYAWLEDLQDIGRDFVGRVGVGVASQQVGQFDVVAPRLESNDLWWGHL
jgi:hypothetical protein